MTPMRIKTATVVLLLASTLALAAVACTSTPASDTGRGPVTVTALRGSSSTRWKQTKGVGEIHDTQEISIS